MSYEIIDLPTASFTLCFIHSEKRRESMVEARAKRELMLGQAELTRELTEDDEARDYAAEEVSILTTILITKFVDNFDYGIL